MRLFIGLELNPALRHALAALRGSIEHARWLPPETYHLTLSFLGEVRERHRIDDIDLALSGVTRKPFSLQLSGAGAFAQPLGGARLWVGAERNDALSGLHTRVENAMRRAGFGQARRKFTPHVTLATLPAQDETRLGIWMGLYNLMRFEPMPVSHVTLFRSHLGPDHPVYEPLAHYPLQQSDWHPRPEDMGGYEDNFWQSATPY